MGSDQPVSRQLFVLYDVSHAVPVLVGLQLGSTRLFVNNVFDEEYIEWFFASRFIGLPADIAWPSRPRQIGLEFSYRY